jgi:hypothetical protein
LLTFPIVNVTLKHGRKKINIDCLVDSGASESLFSFDIAALLGIDLNEATPQEYVGIGNVVLQGYKSGVQRKLTGFDNGSLLKPDLLSKTKCPF